MSTDTTDPDDDDSGDDVDPSWLPNQEATAPLEADAADWIDQERTLPDDPSDEAPR